MGPRQRSRVCSLVSGGVDSSVLLWEYLQEGREVWPVYVRCGAVWEVTELEYLSQFLAALRGDHLRRLTVLECPVNDLYPGHWSLTGQGVPGFDAPDCETYLPGRNILLLSKVAVFCAQNGIREAALAGLASNPFPDASRRFIQQIEQSFRTGLDTDLTISCPYSGLAKRDVILRGERLPLHLTISCMDPKAGLACGSCNKCAERLRAFEEAGRPDPAEYAPGSGAAFRRGS